jgi:Methyltransferase domain
MIKSLLKSVRDAVVAKPGAGASKGVRVDTAQADPEAAAKQMVGHPMPIQNFKPVISSAEIREGLAGLSPEQAWAHYYDLGEAGETITSSNERYFGKAKGLKIIGTQVVDSIPFVTRRGKVEGLSVLDLTSAEGQHSIELAMAGAGKVVGVEGRKLYVDRSRFIAKCFGATNASFEQGDVRKISPTELGKFELVLFFGILHHLGADDFLPMLKLLREVTSDTLMLYTHTAENGADLRFGKRLSAPMTNKDGYTGRLYREHPDGLSPEELERRVRSSLDNTFSFWAKEAELLRALKAAGFPYIARQLHPNPFGDAAGDFRVMYVCRT